MKYDWENMSAEQKQKAFYQEALLETHNGTTKQDLVNIIQWLYDYYDFDISEVE